jgi:hypothetical protein
MGGGMRGGGRRGGGERRGAVVAALRDLMTPTPRLTIAEGDGAVSLTDAEGQVLQLATNGKKEKHVFGSETLETKTKWDGANLVVEISAGGTRVVRTYAVVLTETTRQLQILTKLARSGNDREIKHVYDVIP